MTKNYYRRAGDWRGKNRESLLHRQRFTSLKHHLKIGLLLKNLSTLIILAGVFGFFVAAVMFAVFSRELPDPNQLTNRSVVQSTKIFDKTGEHLLYEIHGGEKRTLKKLQAGFCNDDDSLELDQAGIPLYALQATIAAEDHNFCSHGGYSVTGLLRAVIFRGSRGGGSTLTQQLIKNAILTNEKTITRKVKELILSVELERRYSKDQILQIYFNEIPYGSTNYGIESAAQTYFGKTVSELSLPEAATLAALPKAPTTYLNNPEKLEARRDFILDEMLKLGFINKYEHDLAVETTSAIDFHVTNIVAPHFVFFVKEQLEETYGQKAVEQGGLKVITTIDYEMQIAAEGAVKNGVEANGERLGFTNAALVAIDPKNGHVLSMVGSKDYFDEEIDGSVNVTTSMRQPGSSFKPIVYTAAFERGYTPNTILWDVNTVFKTDVGDYAPLNYAEHEFGPVTIRQALQGSLNTPAVKTLYMLGLENAFEFAKKFGYTTFSDLSNYGLSFVLGGAEVKLLEHTNAYATLANDGKKHSSVSILKVEDSKGNVLMEWEDVDGEQIIEPNLARITTNVLSDNGARAFVFGANSPLQLGDRPVAAKTGTTNDAHDAWILGYTPSLAAGVWAGNNDNSEMADNSDGSNAAGPIWNAFMRAALGNSPVETFPAPEIKSTGKNILDGILPYRTVTIDTLSGKLATEFTPPEYKKEIRCAEFHSILHYVDPNNPLGPNPDKPEENEQYASWEASIQNWIERKNSEDPASPAVNRCEFPAETDDLHTEQNKPTVTLSQLKLNDGRLLDFDYSVSSPRPVSRIEYWIDNTYVTKSASPEHVSFEAPPEINAGNHALKIYAFDDIGNVGKFETSVSLSEPARVSAVQILEPLNNQTIERSVESFPVSLQLRNPSRFTAVTLYASQRTSSSTTRVGSVLKPSSPFVTILWPLQENGSWVLTAVAETDNNQIETTVGTIVNVKDAPTTSPNEQSFDPFGILNQ